MSATGWFALSLAASALWGVILWTSDRGIARIWPPRRGNWITAFWAWGLTIAIYMGLINAGSLDWNALGWPAWLRWGLGGIGMTLASCWVQGRGIVDLGLKGTSGWNVGLVTSGAYTHRRHPQYLGQIVSLAGLGILFATWPALIAAFCGVAALFYASLVEDRALSAHPDHVAYRARVRFF